MKLGLRLPQEQKVLDYFENQGSVNGGFQTVVRVLSGEQIPLPPFLPQFNLLFTSILVISLAIQKNQGSVNGGFQMVVRVLSGEQIPLLPFLPQFNLLFTSILPFLKLFLTSFLPVFNLTLTSASSRLYNHGLETTVYRLLGKGPKFATKIEGAPLMPVSNLAREGPVGWTSQNGIFQCAVSSRRRFPGPCGFAFDMSLFLGSEIFFLEKCRWEIFKWPKRG